MEDWKINYVDSLNRKRGDISKARGACTEEQLRVLDRLVKVVDAFEFEFTENLAGGGSANDMRVGSFTDLFVALSGYRAQWVQDHTPDFYDDVMELKRQETADEVHSFEQLYEDLNNLSVVMVKECVSCGKALTGRQKKLCGKKKCADKYYGKK